MMSLGSFQVNIKLDLEEQECKHQIMKQENLEVILLIVRRGDQIPLEEFREASDQLWAECFQIFTRISSSKIRDTSHAHQCN